MSNRLYEHKRSSLELSESESDDYDYRGHGSAEKDEYTESYNSQGRPYSPESNYLETSGKPNPKSILKENSVSASKSKRNIIINETLNETHKIAQKNESNQTSPEKRSLDESDKRYRDYIREDRLESGGTSNTYGQSAEKEDYTDEDDEYGSKLTSKYSQDEYDRPHSGFKNRLVVGQGVTEFQKAHAKKIEQEREQTYSSKGVRESADQVREKWLLEKEKKGLDTDELDDSKGTGHRGYEGLGYSDKKDTYGSRHSDPAAKFERMEDKISFVEKELDNYSRALMRNTMTQEEKTKSLNKVCEDFEHRLQDLKEDIDQSLYGKKKTTDIYDTEALERSKIAEERAKNGVSSKSSKLRKSSERTGGKKKGTSSTFKKLQEEIERLKEENGALKERVVEKEERDKERTIKGNAILDTNLAREREIIDTIERLKKKLRKAITKKLHRERENEIARTMDETTAKGLGKNYTSYGLHYKDVLKRKAIEEKTSVKENAHLLHRGIPVTYKDYESPVFAEKLAKTVKK